MRRDDWISKLHFQESLNEYYLENGKIVYTPVYHIKRGSCCGSKCRHCPFNPKHEKGTTTLQNQFKNKL